jgi:hypothetical protein
MYELRADDEMSISNSHNYVYDRGRWYSYYHTETRRRLIKSFAISNAHFIID